MALIYSDEAIRTLKDIIRFGIANDFPDPIAYVATLRDRLHTLYAAGHRGKLSKVIRGAREWVLPPHYVVYYVEVGDDIRIAEIFDTRRLPKGY